MQSQNIVKIRLYLYMILRSLILKLFWKLTPLPCIRLDIYFRVACLAFLLREKSKCNWMPQSQNWDFNWELISKSGNLWGYYVEKVKVRKLPDHEYFIYLICKRSPAEEEFCTGDIKSQNCICFWVGLLAHLFRIK